MQEVITADVVHFDTQQRFDRVVSIEMFEHMKNYQVPCQHTSLLRVEPTGTGNSLQGSSLQLHSCLTP